MKILSGKPVFTLSPEEIAEAERRAERREEEIRKQKLFSEFLASGLNNDSLRASFERFQRHTEEQKQLYSYSDMLCHSKAMKTLVMCGKNGTGKTWSAACCLREMGGIYRKSIEICSDYDDAGKMYGKEKRSAVLSRYAREHFLVIDEVLRTSHTSEREVISYIVSERIENGLKTIVIGNCSGSEIMKVLDGAVMSRIQQSGIIYELTGDDQRCM